MERVVVVDVISIQNTRPERGRGLRAPDGTSPTNCGADCGVCGAC